NASVKFQYPQYWETVKLADIELCETHAYPCFFLIGSGDSYTYSYVVMSEIPVDSNQSLDELDQYWWDQFRPDSGAANFTEAQEIKIDGARAISHDFELIFPDDRRYFRQIHVMNGSTLLEITFWAVNKETFNKKRDDFMKVLNSLDLKSA
ncbi:MAG: hypothetical protein K8I82_06045, partial [Anaerolineae bacterium]|nr:hypothetical protein [Anaerolineae bacterium]